MAKRKGYDGVGAMSTLTLDIPPDWDTIDSVRERTLAFLRELGEPPAVIDAIAMVVCELTENAVKYGRFGGDDHVHITVEHGSKQIIVEVRNPTGGEDLSQLKRLDRTIQWIRGYQDPFEAYLTRLREVSLQKPDYGESGLGLVRIAYEGESSLDFYVGEAGDLAVSAVYQR